MRSIILGFCSTLMLATALVPAAAQESAPSEPQAESPSPDYAKPLGPEDPFNRGTPRGAVYGFIQAANDGDYEDASQYLDLRRLPKKDWASEGPNRARQLHVVLDRNILVDFDLLSPENSGQNDDGMPSYRDLLARIDTEAGPVDLLLQRVPRAGDGQRIWKIASVTVEQTPALYAEFGYGELIDRLPKPLTELRFFGVELWQWLGLMILVVLAWILSLLISTALVRILHAFYSRTKTKLDDRVALLVRGPVRLMVALGAFTLALAPLRLYVGALGWVQRIQGVLLVVAIGWLALRLVDFAVLVMRDRMVRAGNQTAVPALVPGQRVVKAIVFMLASLALLNATGFNVTALLAGLGVGGIAIALAAQTTIENLFGGLTLYADQPIRVGDFCRFGDKLGTVEEIGLRSTRIRTLDRTIVTVPNGEFSKLQIESFAQRDRIHLKTMLGLRYETTPEQLRYVLAKLRELLLAHPRVITDGARVRFVSFGAYSLDLEVYCYINSADWAEFLHIREDLYLRMMDVVTESGSGFAFPSTTTYIGHDDGLDVERQHEAHARVAAWRAEKVLPFPDHSVAERDRLADTLDYPPKESGSDTSATSGARSGDDDH